MRVSIDLSNLHPLNKQRAIGFYADNLIEALKKYTNCEVVVLANRKERVDIIHFPFFDLFRATLPIKKIAPSVVTIHDVIPLVFPENFPSGFKGKINFYRQKLALKNVNAIITDSLSSKKDITTFLHIDSSKIYPIYLAPSAIFKVINDQKILEGIRKKYNLPKEFAIFTGNINWNKNLNNLARASIESGTNLVLTGAGFENKNNLDHPELKSYSEFLKNFAQHHLIHMVGFVPQQDLVIIMNMASALLFPSFYEGFGLPILEAQACGTPVITSNVSSMPEVAGKAALFVDPENTYEIIQAINELKKNPKLRDDLKKGGLENIKKFSWKKTALKTLEVYQEVLSHGK